MGSETGRKKRVAIACQGGGTHTAFTAGALKKFLAEADEYEIVALSGSSGGAVCALLAWYALLKDDQKRAGELLDSFWKRDNAARSFERIVNDFLLWANRATQAMAGVPVSNPYHFPRNLYSPDYWQNKLRQAIEKNVQFDEIDVLVTSTSPKLFIGAVDAITGEFVVFRSHKPVGVDGSDGDSEREEIYVYNDQEDGISAEAMLASAAVPFLFKAVQIGEGVYWDGLYSQNPPVRDLAYVDPDEIWVIQINPEEIDEEPKTTSDIWDRRNQLAGNMSLNQELYFVRKTNEWIRKYGVEKPIIKVRRIEQSLRLDASSKLDRSPEFLEKLIDHGEEQTAHFLDTIRIQHAFEDVWNRKDEEAVMNFFSDAAEIRFILPGDSPTTRLHYSGKQGIRKLVQRSLKYGFWVEQSRDHRMVGEKMVYWILVCVGPSHTPVKGRAEIVVREGKIESFTFYPLDRKAKEKLREIAPNSSSR